jgi:hypothetical protein
MAKAQQLYQDGQLAKACKHWQFANEVAAQGLQVGFKSPDVAKRVESSSRYLEQQRLAAYDWCATPVLAHSWTSWCL